MDAQEARAAERTLRQTLVAFGYAWVVDQVDESLYGPVGQVDVESRGRGEISRSPQARLRALIHATEFAVNEGQRLRHAVAAHYVGVEGVAALRYRRSEG